MARIFISLYLALVYLKPLPELVLALTLQRKNIIVLSKLKIHSVRVVRTTRSWALPAILLVRLIGQISKNVKNESCPYQCMKHGSALCTSKLKGMSPYIRTKFRLRKAVM